MDPLNPLLPKKRYKVFLVEEDDDDRERVIRFLVDKIVFETDPNYGDVYSDTPPIVNRYSSSTKYTVEMELVAGTSFTFEEYGEEYDEDSE